MQSALQHGEPFEPPTTFASRCGVGESLQFGLTGARQPYPLAFEYRPFCEDVCYEHAHGYVPDCAVLWNHLHLQNRCRSPWKS